MSINVLIDNCVFIKIISKTEFSPTLRQLQFLVEQKYITLLVPEVLLREWQNHRESLKNEIQGVFRDERNQVKFRKLLNDPSAEFVEEKIEEAIESLHTQISVVDALLSSHGIIISATDKLHGQIRDQRNKRKAPFKKPHKDNYNDAELIFTALNHSQDQIKSELYFISENKAEFGYGDPPILHPEITEQFPLINVKYFLGLKEAYAAFDELGVPRYEKKEEEKAGKIRSKILIDKTKSVLDQLSEYLEKSCALWTFIPKKLLFEHYPFILVDSFIYHHHPFTVVTDNEEVYALLTKVKIMNGEVLREDPSLITSTEEETKIIRIFQLLGQNNIEKVAFKNNDPIDIVYSCSILCNCPICLYYRMDWTNLIENTVFPERSESDNSFTGKLRNAYGQYKVGNYYKSALLLQELLTEHTDKKGSLIYIAKFNLKHLAPVLQHYYWEDSNIQQLAKELSEIDLEKVYKECVQYEDKEILDWLHKKLFISETLSAMHEKVNQITDHFYGQNTGFNNNTLRLAEQYATMESFLTANSIIYDYYSEFESLTTLFIQGLLASYGCNPLMNGKLNNLNDYTLKKLLFAGNADTMQKYLIRYKLKDIQYKSDAEVGQTIISVIISMAENYNSIEKSYDKNKQILSNYFWDYYTELVNNALTILAMIELSDQTLNTVMEKILILLEKDNKLILFRTLKHLRFLFNRKYRSFYDDMLRKFYLATFKKKEFHSDRFFEMLAGIISERKLKVNISEADFLLVRENFLTHSADRQSVNSWFDIGYLFSILSSEKQKTEISSYTKTSIEANFDSGKYYLACMFDMMLPEEKLNNLYASDIEAVIQQGPRERPFNNKQYYVDSRIDNYLNFCLKYSLNIPETIRDKAAKMGTYYQWLFNMEGFNYANFNTKWLYNHFTVYFKQEFRKCQQLKDHLLQLIKADPETETERIFMIIYCFPD